MKGINKAFVAVTIILLLLLIVGVIVASLTTECNKSTVQDNIAKAYESGFNDVASKHVNDAIAKPNSTAYMEPQIIDTTTSTQVPQTSTSRQYDNSQQENEISELKTRIEQSKIEISECSITKEQLQKDLTNAINEYNFLVDELESLRMSNSSNNNNNSEVVTRYQQTIRERESTIGLLQSEVSNQTDQLNNLKSSVMAMEVTLTQRTDNINLLNSQLIKANASRTELESNLITANASLAQRTDNINLLNSQLITANASRTELESNLITSNASLAQRTDNINLLNSQLITANTSRSELESKLNTANAAACLKAHRTLHSLLLTNLISKSLSKHRSLHIMLTLGIVNSVTPTSINVSQALELSRQFGRTDAETMIKNNWVPLETKDMAARIEQLISTIKNQQNPSLFHNSSHVLSKIKIVLDKSYEDELRAVGESQSLVYGPLYDAYVKGTLYSLINDKLVSELSLVPNSKSKFLNEAVASMTSDITKNNLCNLSDNDMTNKIQTYFTSSRMDALYVDIMTSICQSELGRMTATGGCTYNSVQQCDSVKLTTVNTVFKDGVCYVSHAYMKYLCDDSKLAFDRSNNTCILNEQICERDNLSYNPETNSCNEKDLLRFGKITSTAWSSTPQPINFGTIATDRRQYMEYGLLQNGMILGSPLLSNIVYVNPVGGSRDRIDPTGSNVISTSFRTDPYPSAEVSRFKYESGRIIPLSAPDLCISIHHDIGATVLAKISEDPSRKKFQIFQWDPPKLSPESGDIITHNFEPQFDLKKSSDFYLDRRIGAAVYIRPRDKFIPRFGPIFFSLIRPPSFVNIWVANDNGTFKDKYMKQYDFANEETVHKNNLNDSFIHTADARIREASNPMNKLYVKGSLVTGAEVRFGTVDSDARNESWEYEDNFITPLADPTLCLTVTEDGMKLMKKTGSNQQKFKWSAMELAKDSTFRYPLRNSHCIKGFGSSNCTTAKSADGSTIDIVHPRLYIPGMKVDPVLNEAMFDSHLNIYNPYKNEGVAGRSVTSGEVIYLNGAGRSVTSVRQ